MKGSMNTHLGNIVIFKILYTNMKILTIYNIVVSLNGMIIFSKLNKSDYTSVFQKRTSTIDSDIIFQTSTSLWNYFKHTKAFRTPWTYSKLIYSVYNFNICDYFKHSYISSYVTTKGINHGFSSWYGRYFKSFSI